jgi:hypothetical protein
MTAPTVKLTPALLAELDAKAERGERASPEPWVAHDEYVSSRHELVGRMSSTATADFIVAASPATVRALVAEVRVARESRRVLAEVLAAVRCQPKGTPHRMINDYVPEGCDTDCPFEGREADCFEKTANRIARVILGLPPKEAPDD